ncbi:MAG: amino acid adenylation domain-containing protein, partial [Clostridiaceae bacterium]|nr:amino acid adenylation domain-containing protein [Clostridiaceae bacterium]
IGKPIANTQIYIMNGMNLCAVGVPGELCISGAGVARGYLNREELTAEKFIDNPYGEGKLYRTGDLARWMPDGNIEYLGRVDDQVKIRGYRIELGEIESVIRKINSVKDAVVVARSDREGEKCICAYIVSNEEINAGKIKEAVRMELPEYMVPGYIMQIKELPVTRNGKLDKKKLPEIEVTSEKTYIPPRNETEEKICKVFGEVLGVEWTGIEDNFFEMGGHSLRATRLINRIEAEAGIRLSLREIFKNPTPAQLSVLIESAYKEEYTPIPKAAEKEYYEMSSAQKRLFLINEIEDTGTAYNMPAAIEIKGSLDIEKVKVVFKTLTERHESLRTSFHIVDGETVQRVNDEAAVEIEYEKRDIKDDDDKNKLLSDFVRAYDLGKAPLMRVKVVKTGEEENILLFDMHHIISDGMSINIIKNEFNALYNGMKLDGQAVQYKDYSEWMRTRDITHQKEYWIKEFSEKAPVLDMPLDYKRPQKQSFRGSIVEGVIGDGIKDRVRDLCRKTGATEYMVLLSALMIMLGKYSRQEDIVVGSSISGRIHKDTENIIGMFVNTLAMRGRPEKGKKYIDFLKEVKETCLKAYENQEYPFEELIDAIEVSRDMSRNPLFDVMFVLQNNEEVALNEGEAKLRGTGDEHTVSKFDLTFNVGDVPEGYKVGIEYCTDLYKKESVIGMKEHLEAILGEVAESPELKIDEIKMISEEEKKLVTEKFNDTLTEYPSDKTLAELFEEQVEKTPENIAVVFEEKKLKYSELNKRANQLAYKLRELGVKPDDFVVVLGERSLEMIIGICAVIKAGGAYVPIDPSYPQERIEYMISDCKPKVILVYDAKIDTQIPVIDLSDRNVTEGNQGNPQKVSTANHLVYIIYTSGTTGKPKGVMVEHRGVIRLVRNQNYVKLDSNTVILQTGVMSFDASTFEVWGALLNGGSLILTDNDVLMKPELMEECILKNKVNTMWLTATLFNQIVDLNVKMFESLEYLLIGGEKLSEKHVKKFKENNIKTILINGYGPTESTTFTTTYRIPDAFESIPIGKPISNTKVYIMNDGNLCGVGIQGELCVAGAGLARGYLNMRDLTEEKFIDNLFGEGKLYRTGDIARWTYDGIIEYLGRMDEQVKIRGYRIELGEIECVIRKVDYVIDAAVIVRDNGDGEKFICAYIVSDEVINTKKLKEVLRKDIPEYMIPAFIMQVEKLPVTRNGKIDRRALPSIEAKSTAEFVPPGNPLEQELSKVWCEVLNIETVGVNDCFFDLGGDSLKALRAISKLSGMNISVKLSELFQNSTIRELANYINSSTTEKQEVYDCRNGQIFAESIENNNSTNDVKRIEKELLSDIARMQNEFAACILQTDIVRKYKATGVQKYFITTEGLSGTCITYDGNASKEQIDISLTRLINEQQAFRSEICMENDTVVLEHNTCDKVLNIPYIDLAAYESSIREILIGGVMDFIFTTRYNPEKSLLYRILLIRIQPNKIILALPFHHCMFDATSHDIIERMFLSYIRNPNNEVYGSSSGSYYDYSQQLLNGPVNVDEGKVIDKYILKDYIKQSKELHEKLALYSVDDIKNFSVEINAERCMNRYSMLETAFAIYCRLLKNFYEFESIPVKVISFGRRYGKMKYYDTVGAFVDYLPILVQLNKGNPIEHLKSVTERTKFASDYCINFASLAYHDVPGYKDISNMIRTSMQMRGAVFNYQGISYEKAYVDMQSVFSNNNDTFLKKKEKPHEVNISFTARAENNMLHVNVSIPSNIHIEELRDIVLLEAEATVNYLSSEL